MPKGMQRLLEHKGFTLFVITYTVLLGVGSLVNTGTLVSAPNNFDKVIHFAAYFGLAFVWMVWNRFRKPSYQEKKVVKPLLLIAGLAAVYGIFIEVLQGVLTTYRVPDGWDILANTLGVGVALLFVLLLINKTTVLKTNF